MTRRGFARARCVSVSVTTTTGTPISSARSSRTRTWFCTRPYASSTTASPGASVSSSSANDVPVCTSARLGLPMRSVRTWPYSARWADGPMPAPHDTASSSRALRSAASNCSDETLRVERVEVGEVAAQRRGEELVPLDVVEGAAEPFAGRRVRAPGHQHLAELGQPAIAERLGGSHDGGVAGAELFGQRGRRQQRALGPELEQLLGHAPFGRRQVGGTRREPFRVRVGRRRATVAFATVDTIARSIRY